MTVTQVESFFSQYALCEAMEAKAQVCNGQEALHGAHGAGLPLLSDRYMRVRRSQDCLVEGLEECASHGRGALVKTLIEGGADAHRTSALHM